SSDIARTRATVNGNRVYRAGGELRSDSGAAFGQSALDFIAQFAVHHAIISAGAVDEGGVMDYALEEAEFARLVLSRGERRVVVTEHTKFGRRGLIAVAGWDAVGEGVTDRAPDSSTDASLGSAGATLTLAPCPASARMGSVTMTSARSRSSRAITRGGDSVSTAPALILKLRPAARQR